MPLSLPTIARSLTSPVAAQLNELTAELTAMLAGPGNPLEAVAERLDWLVPGKVRRTPGTTWPLGRAQLGRLDFKVGDNTYRLYARRGLRALRCEVVTDRDDIWLHTRQIRPADWARELTDSLDTFMYAPTPGRVFAERWLTHKP